MAFSIAFTTIAEENGLTETEKGFALASYYFGFTVSQVCTERAVFLFLCATTADADVFTTKHAKLNSSARTRSKEVCKLTTARALGT